MILIVFVLPRGLLSLCFVVHGGFGVVRVVCVALLLVTTVLALLIVFLLSAFGCWRRPCWWSALLRVVVCVVDVLCLC